MTKRKSMIVTGIPTKEVTPPAIIDPTTPEGKAMVHDKAGVTPAHEIPDGERKIVEKSGGAFIEDNLDQEEDVQDVSEQVITGQVENNPEKQEGTHTVSEKVVNGRVEDNPDKEKGTHTLNGNHIVGDGDRVEDDPSKETPTKSVSDKIISGEVEDNPSREEGLDSVTNHVIDGEVAKGANDKGGLQSPSLPVEVTSGELGPSANYNQYDPSLNVLEDGDTSSSDSYDMFVGDSVDGDLDENLNLGSGQEGQIIVLYFYNEPTTSPGGKSLDGIVSTTGATKILHRTDDFETQEEYYAHGIGVCILTSSSYEIKLDVHSDYHTDVYGWRLEHPDY